MTELIITASKQKIFTGNTLKFHWNKECFIMYYQSRYKKSSIGVWPNQTTYKPQ